MNLINKSKKIFNNVLKVIGLPFSCAWNRSFMVMLIKIMSGIIPIIKVYFMALFLDKAITYLSADGDIPFFELGIFVLILIFEKISTTFEKYLSIELKQKIRVHIMEKLIKTWTAAKYLYIENEEYYVIFERVRKDAEEQIFKNFLNVIELVALAVNITAIIIYIGSKSIIAGGGMLGLFCILITISIQGGKIEYKASVEAKKAKIKMDYYERLLIGRENAAEREIFSYKNDIKERWCKQYNFFKNTQLDAESKFLLQYQIGGIFCTVISGIMLSLFLMMINSNKMSYGLFVALGTNIISLIKGVSSEINYQIRNLVKAINYVQDFEKIMNIPKEDIELKKNADFEKIEIKGLKFKYPNQNEYILKGVDVVLEKGKRYALIGENGAGKTTFLKIMIGLYRDYEGKILVDGKELKSHPEYYNLFSTMFQDYAKYSLSLRDNLAIGTEEKSVSEKKIEEILTKYSLEYLKERLGGTYDTILGKLLKESDNLSLGEWQKLALARVDLSKRRFKILDEPTASLDPLSESKVYSMLFKCRNNETFLIISHRLGITTFVDNVFVLSDGKICQSGSPEELLMQDGIYREMYIKQKEWYTA